MRGSFYNSGATDLNGNSQVSFGRSFQMAPFGRLRVTQQKTLFESKFDKRANNLLWSYKKTGTADIVYERSESRNILSVVTTGDVAISQSKQRMNYQPFKGQNSTLTGIFNPTAEDFEGGYWDGSNGVTFRNNGGDLSFNIWKGGSRSETLSRNVAGEWLDPLDGTGKSGLTLDTSTDLLITLDLEWLGIGLVSCYAEIGHQLIEIARFEHSNVAVGVYMQTPNLPVRYQLTSNGGAGSISQICSSVSSEGGQDDNSISRLIDNRTTTISVNAGVIQPLIIWRLQSDYLNATIDPVKASTLCTSANVNYRWCLLLNPTIGGAPVYDALSESSLEYASLISSTPLTATNVVTAGTGYQIDGDYVSNQSRSDSHVVQNRLRIGSDIDGVADIMALCVEPFATGNMTAGVTLSEQL